MGVSVDRPSRQVRAQLANAAAMSCSVPMRCTSCSRVSPWTSAHEEPRDSRPRRLAIPVEASAASWYQAALSTWSASSRSASKAGVAGWPPGCSAAAWKVRAASTSSDARCWTGLGVCIPPSSLRGRCPPMGLNAQKGPGVAPIPNDREDGCEPDRCRGGSGASARTGSGSPVVLATPGGRPNLPGPDRGRVARWERAFAHRVDLVGALRPGVLIVLGRDG
jgi:hypothetical protein